jgi:hypothetical protein
MGGVGVIETEPPPEVAERLHHVETTLWERMFHISGQGVHAAGETFGTWGRGIALFVAVEGIAHRLTDHLAEQHTAEGDRAEFAKASAILQTMGRACLSAWEVRSNVAQGLAHAAHILARTEYELMVVGTFLAKHDVATAERFLSHHVVQLQRYVSTWQAAHGEPPSLDAEGIAAAKQQYDELLTKHGPAFRGDYGWAAASLGRDTTSSKTRVTLSDLESDVQLNYRPQYHLLSVLTHPTQLGTKLVQRRDENQLVDFLQIGPDPGNGMLAEPAVTTIEFLQTLVERCAPVVAGTLGAPLSGLQHDLQALKITARAAQREFRETENAIAARSGMGSVTRTPPRTRAGAG